MPQRKRLSHCLLLSAIFFLIGCETSEELTRSYPGERLEITGLWIRSCQHTEQYQSRGYEYLISSYTMAENQKFSLEKRFFNAEKCQGNPVTSFTYEGHYSEAGKVVADDGALTTRLSLTSRNPDWPTSISSIFSEQVIRLQQDQFFFGYFEQGNTPHIDYETVYTKQ